jgi:glycosyltransferase involved in cell wall biosynthesis
MSSAPLFSVAVPVRNGQDFLDQALTSIASQTYGDFEVVVSDNCSTDSTPEILAHWRKRDSRIQVHRTQTLLPPADNFNRVTGLAKGQWVKYLCHDDLMHPECLSTLKDALACENSDQVGLVGNAEEWLFANGVRHTTARQDAPPERLHGRDVVRSALSGKGASIPALTTALVRKAAWESTSGFDSRFLHFDVFCWMRLLMRWDFVRVHRVLTVNRIHGAQIAVGARKSLRSIDDARSFYARFIEEFGDQLMLSPWERRLALLKAPAMAGTTVAVALLRKEPKTALEIFEKVPWHWWPAVGALAVRAFQAQVRAVYPLRGKVPLHQIYP